MSESGASVSLVDCGRKSMRRLFLNSIPKAGAHLAERALVELGCPRGQGPLGSATLFGRRQVIKSVLRRPWFTADIALVGIEVPAPVRAAWLRRRLDGVARGKYLRGHVQYSGSVAAMLAERDFRLLHMVRDPRDVAVSHAHYMLARPRHPLHRFYRDLDDWESRLAFSITGGWVPGAGFLAPLAERYRLMEGWLTYPGALTLRFEELVGGAGGGSRAAQVEALGALCRLLEIDDTSIESVTEKIFGGSSTFRRGRIGGWKESFSPSHLELLGDGGKWMERWGYAAEGLEAKPAGRGEVEEE